jgi:hypothetical protein
MDFFCDLPQPCTAPPPRPNPDSYFHISGAHFNPAVTLASFIAGETKPTRAALYMIMQLLGGVTGALIAVSQSCT